MHPGTIVGSAIPFISHQKGKLQGLFTVPSLQAPRTSRASLIKGSRSQANALAQQTLIAHWQSIVKILTNYLNVLKANYVWNLKL